MKDFETGTLVGALHTSNTHPFPKVHPRKDSFTSHAHPLPSLFTCTALEQMLPCMMMSINEHTISNLERSMETDLR